MAVFKSRAARGTFRKRKYDVIMIVLAVLLPIVLVQIVTTSTAEVDVSSNDHLISGRHLLQDVSELNCTPRSIHQFPDDFMSRLQRRRGGVLFHIFLTLYLFAATAIVCDDFFVPSLEKLVEVSHIQPDVAGATFMAAGSSAPEFFAAVTGIVFVESDIGLSTIVGSAVFNLLLVNAVCGLFAGMVIYLTWWPVIRDCIYYALSLVLLITVMYDNKIHWYESLIMVLLYVIYVVLMYFNKRVGHYAMNNINIFRDNRKEIKNSEFIMANDTKRPLLSEQVLLPEDVISDDAKKIKENYGIYGTLEKSTPAIEEHEDRHDSLLTPPKGRCKQFTWILMLPSSALMVFTIPDFRRGGRWERLYPLTFLFSIIWIAGLCYVMVWMVTITGDTMDIPDNIMGLTFLAIGSSVPDIFASLLVVQDGYGDMAVSNAVGSNIFDILICLGVPWLLQTTVIKPNSVVLIASKGLIYSTITLLGTIVFLIAGFVVSKWKLTKSFGLSCLIAYFAIIGVSCLYELNVFGNVSLPSCPW